MDVQVPCRPGWPGTACRARHANGSHANGIVGRQTETMVGVAQLVELRIVIPAVVGSSPIVHPIFFKGRSWNLLWLKGPLAQLAEQSDS